MLDSSTRWNHGYLYLYARLILSAAKAARSIRLMCGVGCEHELAALAGEGVLTRCRVVLAARMHMSFMQSLYLYGWPLSFMDVPILYTC